MYKSDFLKSLRRHGHEWVLFKDLRIHKPANLTDASVAGGGNPETAFKATGEMERAIEAALIGNFLDRFICTSEQLTGSL